MPRTQIARFIALAFYVRDFRSIADMKFTVSKQGKNLFSKAYHSEGTSRAGAAVWGGVFAMKGVVSSTMHEVFKDIFSRFVADVRADYKNWPLASADQP